MTERYCLDAQLADIGGELVELDGKTLLPKAVRDRAREARENGEALDMTIVALGGTISKPFVFSDAYLAELAADAPGTRMPKDTHLGGLRAMIRPPRTVGVVRAATAEGGQLAQDVTIGGPDADPTAGDEALRDMALGIMPHFSIQWAGGRTLCSVCNEPLTRTHSRETGHWLGKTLDDGQVVRALFDAAPDGPRARLIDTTLLHNPGADGTHVRSVQLSDDLFKQVPDNVLNEIAIWIEDTRNQRALAQEIPMADEQKTPGPAAPAEPATENESEVVVLADRALKDENQQLREALAHETARRLAVESRGIVLEHMRRGALQLEEQVGIQLRAENPELFDSILDAVPGNPAFEAGPARTPAADPVPAEAPALDDYVALAAQADALAREQGITYEEAHARLRNKQLEEATR